MKILTVIRFLTLMVSVFLINSCQVIGGIFNTGMGVGIFLVLVIVGTIIFIITRFASKGGA